MKAQLIVPLDGSSLGDVAIPHAVALASRLGTGLHLVRVHRPSVPLVGPPEISVFVPDIGWDRQVREEEERWLARRAAEIRDTHGLPVTHELRTGVPAAEICAAAEAHGARAIVCTTHGAGGWAPRWVGSVTDAVVRHATCPVLAMSAAAVVRDEGIRSVLVLLDGSEVAAGIVPHAEWLARAFGADVELFRVVAPPWVGDSLTALNADCADPFGVDSYVDAAKRSIGQVALQLRARGLSVKSTVHVHLSPARAILDHIRSADPDAVALATYGRGLSRVFLGSVADKVLRACGRPVLLFRPPQPAGLMQEHVEHDGSELLAGIA